MEYVTKPNILTFGIAPMKTVASIKECSGRITKYEIVSGCI